MKIPHSKTTIRTKELQAVTRQLESGFITHGTEASAAIDKLCSLVGQAYGSLYSSGTSALFTILRSLVPEKEGEILIPNYICKEVVKAITLAGCNVALYDNSPKKWSSDLENISEKVTVDTKAILVNHTFGIAFRDLDALRSAFPDIYIIEDCCHAIPVNGFISRTSVLKSHCAFYSFNATKLIAAGEGGAVTTNNAEIHKAIVKNRIDGGMSDLSASLFNTQLPDYKDFIDKRKEIADYYLKELPEQATATLRAHDSLYFRFPAVVNNMEPFLQNEEVAFKRGVDDLLHFYRDEEGAASYKNSLKDFNCTISIPIYPSLQQGELESIINNFKHAYHQT